MAHPNPYHADLVAEGAAAFAAGVRTIHQARKANPYRVHHEMLSWFHGWLVASREG